MPGNQNDYSSGANLKWLSMPITHGYITNYQGPGTDTPHYAVDIATPFHTKIGAPWAGTVLLAQQGLPWGTQVFIRRNDNGKIYYLYHLDTLNVHTGDTLVQGQFIGLSGGQNSGGFNPSTPAMSSGPHTHIGYINSLTSYVSTPIGSRPIGPDITPDLKGIDTSKVQPIAVQQNAAEGACAPWDVGCFVSKLNLPSIGIRIGLFIFALVLVIFGGYILIRPEANTAIKDVAKGAVLA
jgi:murein DD-endopeptidase MepM/ murein hydrolase activator NlpD